uniref:ATP synthase F0 subunit 8 n=1 Tax=Ectyoplasia ferox TaxID=458493 RepID=I6LIB8_ECTFE|nr:ATP synthase F0 subunit 8 [Ectyoplasia ferox]ABW76582.1 ATP synthase F0 subunit 8 [Ectyoplasia ferox]
MPQLDILTYLSQYLYTLVFLFVLFLLLINFIIPRIQKQLIIRTKMDDIVIKKEHINIEIFRKIFKL